MGNFFSNLTTMLATEVRKNLRGALRCRLAFIMLDREAKFPEHLTKSSR
jgi:hypothetical protein